MVAGGRGISDVFISYARDDQDVARRFADALEAEGFSVWWDAALRSGEAFDQAIETALRAAKVVVVLWSPRSVVSRWVRAEATLADRNKTLAPVIIEHEQALAAAQRAIEASPDLADAHASMGEVIGRGGAMDFEAARPFYEAALRLDPDCYEGHMGCGFTALAGKHWAEAVEHFEAYRPAGMAGQAYEGLGDREGVLANARRTMARCEALLAAEPDHGGALGFLVTSLCLMGEADRAREWCRRAVLFDPDNARLHYNLACGMAELGDVTAACDLLEGIIDKISSGWLRWIETDNSLDGIREDARFKAILARGYARFADQEEGQRA